MNARVIAAFPATGKSHLAARTPGVIDSDSSSFSWTHRGPDVRVRHPEWPGNYMHHIREMLQSSLRLVLVSTHAEVRAALVDHAIPFTLVYPGDGLREEYRERMQRRGSPAALICKVIDELWSPALAECRDQQGCDHITLGPTMYLSDALPSALPQPDDDMIERAASELALIDGYDPNLYPYDWWQWQCNAERYREKARRILTAALRPTPEDQAGRS